MGVRGGRDEVIDMVEILIGPPERRGWHKLVGIIESLR
jgi:hypothetical protein